MMTLRCPLCGFSHRAVERCGRDTVDHTPAVNAKRAVNKKRGAYPASDERRAYMRAYMAKRRAAE
jgi:hypothetical protein